MTAPPNQRARGYRHPIEEALEICDEVLVYAVIHKDMAEYVRITKKEFREVVLKRTDPDSIEYRLDEETNSLYIN